MRKHVVGLMLAALAMCSAPFVDAASTLPVAQEIALVNGEDDIFYSEKDKEIVVVVVVVVVVVDPSTGNN